MAARANRVRILTEFSSIGVFRLWFAVVSVLLINLAALCAAVHPRGAGPLPQLLALLGAFMAGECLSWREIEHDEVTERCAYLFRRVLAVLLPLRYMGVNPHTPVASQCEARLISKNQYLGTMFRIYSRSQAQVKAGRGGQRTHLHLLRNCSE